MRVVDFFCGGGGFSEGFRQAGFDVILAVDNWKPAVDTFRCNHPGVNVILDDVVRISNLQDEEFEKLVPDSEVIIGSPPCQAFSHSNKSGTADKSDGIELIEAYLKIIARKKSKTNSILKYWILENVPSVIAYIKDIYIAKDFGLEGDFILETKVSSSGIYNAKYFGAPTNRKRYLCGEFPEPAQTHTDGTVICLKAVLESLGDPLSSSPLIVKDLSHPGFGLLRQEVTDHRYVRKLAPFECNTALRLKQDKGYMGSMAFPENLNKPARTIMATMSASSREAMILKNGVNGYRLPTVRETASMMSYPIDYWFVGNSKGIKHTIVGNSVPPKLSYALAKAIAHDFGIAIPDGYIPIVHDLEIDFKDLNGVDFPEKTEKPKRAKAKFKYHIPHLVLSSYRVELTNYHSDFVNNHFIWDVEIHFSQGKEKAAVFKPAITLSMINKEYRYQITHFIEQILARKVDFKRFQELFCMTSEQRKSSDLLGPYELLYEIRQFIDSQFSPSNQSAVIQTGREPESLPQAIVIGYYILDRIVKTMGEIK